MAKERATTTEGLSVLNSSQVERMRQNNKGKSGLVSLGDLVLALG